jgi:hypothetical protein
VRQIETYNVKTVQGDKCTWVSVKETLLGVSIFDGKITISFYLVQESFKLDVGLVDQRRKTPKNVFTKREL